MAHKNDQVADAMDQLSPAPDMSERSRELFLRILRLAKDQLKATEGEMTALINVANPMIQKILELGSQTLLHSSCLHTVARELMHFALVYSGYTFGSSALKMLHEQKMWLLTLILKCRDDLDVAAPGCEAEYRTLMSAPRND
ncbi:MAG: hypothetical protein IPK26_20425 [Planctomycetes bacterium]|nr:hypothetical protein [Planctomycetota bacterium]